MKTDHKHLTYSLFERQLLRPRILRAFGWNVEAVLTRDWLADPDAVVRRLQRLLKQAEKDAQA